MISNNAYQSRERKKSLARDIDMIDSVDWPIRRLVGGGVAVLYADVGCS